MSRVSQLKRYFIQDTRQQLLLTLIDFFVRGHSPPFCITTFRFVSVTQIVQGKKNQLGIKTILHGYLLLQSGRNPCILTTNFKSVECIVYRVTTNAVFKGNIFFLLESGTFIATQRLQSKLQFLLKTSFFYRQTVFNATLFPLRHIFHATQQIQ